MSSSYTQTYIPFIHYARASVSRDGPSVGLRNSALRTKALAGPRNLARTTDVGFRKWIWILKQAIKAATIGSILRRQSSALRTKALAGPCNLA